MKIESVEDWELKSNSMSLIIRAIWQPSIDDERVATIRINPITPKATAKSLRLLADILENKK